MPISYPHKTVDNVNPLWVYVEGCKFKLPPLNPKRQSRGANFYGRGLKVKGFPWRFRGVSG